MNLRKKLYLGSACCLFVAAVWFLAGRNSRLDHASAQDSQSVPLIFRQREDDPERFREELTSESISKLIAAEEIVVDQSVLQESVSASNTFHLRIDSEPDSSAEQRLSRQKRPVRSLRLLGDRKTHPVPVTRKRAFELSETQVVLFAVDDLKRVVWWDIFPDPRILRAETADDAGNLRGRILYRERADLLFSLPARPEITAVYLYSPDWNGKHFDLHLIGNFDVRSSGSDK